MSYAHGTFVANLLQNCSSTQLNETRLRLSNYFLPISNTWVLILSISINQVLCTPSLSFLLSLPSLCLLWHICLCMTGRIECVEMSRAGRCIRSKPDEWRGATWWMDGIIKWLEIWITGYMPLNPCVNSFLCMNCMRNRLPYYKQSLYQYEIIFKLMQALISREMDCQYWYWHLHVLEWSSFW